MSGGSLSTKGLVSGGGGVDPVEEIGAPPPPAAVYAAASSPSGDVLLIIPTASNICLLASENITSNLRIQQPSDLVLPNMYKRAYLVAYETDEIAVVKPKK